MRRPRHTSSGSAAFSETIPEHIRGLLSYISQSEEMANDDLAIKYFRHLYPDTFKKQQEASGADGYVPGSFILELKGKTTGWLSGLFQALAYKKFLDFSQIVVAAKEFLVLWRIDDLPEEIREAGLSGTGSPSQIGARLGRKYASRRRELLALATWNGTELSSSLFLSNPSEVISTIRSFERSLEAGRKIRQRITLGNFVDTLRDMQQYFDVDQPVKAVRAFYSMVYAWSENSTLELSERFPDQAALRGERIDHLIPAKRTRFKDFVESRVVQLQPGENIDDFFARYDQALDAVDRNFRIRHGIFLPTFTSANLLSGWSGGTSLI